MKRYIILTIKDQTYRFVIDNYLDKHLSELLKDDYIFDSEGLLNIDSTDIDKTYRVMQIIYDYQIEQMKTWNIASSTSSRIKTLERDINLNKGTVYYSDLMEFKDLFLEANQIFRDNENRNSDKIAEVQTTGEIKKEEVKPLEKEKDSTSISEDEGLGEDKQVEEAEESKLQDIPSSSDTDSETDEKRESVSQVIDRVVVCKTNEEFQERTNQSAVTTVERIVDNAKKSDVIYLPPNFDVDEVVIKIVDPNNEITGLKQKVAEYRKQKEDYNMTMASFKSLDDNLRYRGLEVKNLNYFGDKFIEEYKEICRKTGTDPEAMFRDYFSASTAQRYNSPLNKFISRYIKFSGGHDESLRDVFLATLVKKAISSNLISSKYNNYLSEAYKNVSYNRSGYVYFDQNLNRSVNVNSGISNNLETGMNVGSSVSVNNGLTSSGGLETENSVLRPNISTMPRSTGSKLQDIPTSTNISFDGNEKTFLDEALIDPSNEGKFNTNVGSDNVSKKPFTDLDLNKANGSGEPGVVRVPTTITEKGSSSELLGHAEHLGINEEENQQSSQGVSSFGEEKKPQNRYKTYGVKNEKSIVNIRGYASTKMNGRFNSKVKNGINQEDADLDQENNLDNDFQNEVNNESDFSNQDDNLNSKSNSTNKNNDLNQKSNLPGNKTSEGNPTNPIGRSRENPNGLKDNLVNNAKEGIKEGLKEEVKDKAKEEIKTKGKEAVIAFIKKNPYVLAIIGGLLLFLLILIIIFAASNQDTEKSMGLGGYSYFYIEGVCEEIYVHDTPGGEDGTYPLEEYIAGVVAHEVGAFNNDTMYEVAAIAARTYALRRLQGSSDCSIAGNTTAQVFGKTDNERIIAAANNTRGLVLVRDGEMVSTEYDAFCWDTKDDNYYHICQKEYDTGEILKIPVDWAEEYVGKITGKKFLTTPRYQSHGRGMSQDGAFYLATEQNYSRDQILTFFYGSSAKLMSIYKSSYSGEFSIDPNDSLYQNLAFLTDKSLEDLLTSNGSSIEEFNAYLANTVETAGVGTRAAVVNVGVSLIGNLANMGYKLNYDWGGKYYAAGVNKNWGSAFDASSSCSSYGAKYNISKCLSNYKWRGFDCSGFVSWAFLNGFGLSSLSELQSAGIFSLIQTSSAAKVELNSNSAVCKAGDVLIKPGSHIVLVIGYDDAAKKYIVAESTGSNLTTGYGGLKLSYYDYNASGYFCGDMSSIYKESIGE